MWSSINSGYCIYLQTIWQRIREPCFAGSSPGSNPSRNQSSRVNATACPRGCQQWGISTSTIDLSKNSTKSGRRLARLGRPPLKDAVEAGCCRDCLPTDCQSCWASSDCRLAAHGHRDLPCRRVRRPDFLLVCSCFGPPARYLDSGAAAQSLAATPPPPGYSSQAPERGMNRNLRLRSLCREWSCACGLGMTAATVLPRACCLTSRTSPPDCCPLLVGNRP